MKKKTQIKLPSVDALITEEQRKVLEDKAKELMNSPNTSLAITEDVRLEKVKHPQGDRLQARARTGKFISKIEASTIVVTKRTANFLEDTDPNTGKSRHQTLLEAGYAGALIAAAEPTGRSLGNYTKVMEMYDEQSGHRAAREEAIAKANREVNTPVSVVVINCPENMMDKNIIDFEEELRKRAEKKQPTFAEVIGIETNPPQEQ